MKVKSLMLSACLLAGIALFSCNKDDDEEQLNDNDRNFLVKASIGNSAEISTATLATNKATNAMVKSFAQQMLTEHTTAQTELKALGTSVGYAVKDTIDPAHVAIAAQLNALSGRAFDSAYIHGQVADHQTTVTLFQTEQTSGRHTSVLNYAQKYLPHIQMHLTRADSISNAYFRR